VIAARLRPRAEPVTAPVRAFAADPATHTIIAGAFAARGWPAAAVQIGGVEQALQLDDAGAALDLLLVDIVQSPAPAADIAALAAGGVARRIIALGAVNDVTLYRELVAAGAADYLVKPVDERTLTAALDQAAQPEPAGAADAPSRTIAVMGARGGSGATTLAVNLASLLAEEHRKRVALLDLDPHFGTAALALDVQPGRGLREVLERPDRIDSLFIERALERHGERLRILAAEEPLEDELAIDTAAPSMLLHEVRRHFDAVVVDLPRNAGLAGRQVLAAASHIVIVLEFSLAGLRDGMRLQALARDVAPQARLILAAGAGDRADPKVGRAELERGLAGKLDLVVPWDRKAVATAAAAGKSVGEAAGGSKLHVALRDLARLTGESPAAKRGLSLFRRVRAG
jgi:pilus assembly protein CpaE